jgi:hypothetical protein
LEMARYIAQIVNSICDNSYQSDFNGRGWLELCCVRGGSESGCAVVIRGPLEPNRTGRRQAQAHATIVHALCLVGLQAHRRSSQTDLAGVGDV